MNLIDFAAMLDGREYGYPQSRREKDGKQGLQDYMW